MLQTDKLIILDFSVYIHKSIFSLKFNPDMSATYTAMNMILGSLTRIGATPDSTIMVVCDGRNSWRKEIESAYKGNRKAHREDSGIDFDHWFKEFDKLREQLNQQTNWIFVGPIPRIEADDIAAVACRYFQDVPEIVLVTIDSDWEQMWVYDNVKIFHLGKKEWKVKPEDYNVYAELAKKVHKEASDNLVTAVTNSEEYDKRLMCVDLTRLPEWVEKSITDILSDQCLYEKNLAYEVMPFSKSLQPRYDALYNDKSKQILYTVQVAKAEEKDARIKKRKIEAKEKEKRKKERELKKMTKLQSNLKIS